MRHVLTLVDARVAVIATALAALSALATYVLRRRNVPAGRLFLALLAAVLIATLTIANRGVVVSDDGLSRDLTWWTRSWGDLPALVGGDIGWWFNIALFVPAGLTWTLLSGRPRAVLTACVGVVLVVETLHATVLSGAGDPADVVANLLGAAIGTSAGLAWTRGRRSVMVDPLELGADQTS